MRYQFLLAATFFGTFAFAADPNLPDGTAKARKQLAGLKHPDGLELELFATGSGRASHSEVFAGGFNAREVLQEYAGFPIWPDFAAFGNLDAKHGRARPLCPAATAL